MALPNVNITRSDGNLSRPPASEDGISGLIEYGTHGAGQYKIFTLLDSLTFCSIGSALYYHISEYFRFSSFPLYVQTVNASPTTFSEVVDLKNFSIGSIRQVAILNLRTIYSTSQMTALQAIANQCELEYAPLQILHSAALNSTSGLADLLTLTTLNCPRVSFNIAEDLTPLSGAATVRAAIGFCGSVGTQLGLTSLSQVSQNIGFVKNFNIVGAEFSVPGFITGDKLSAVSKIQLDSLHGFHYTFLRTFVGLSGVWFNSDYTAVDGSTSDFDEVYLNRTYDKAFRNLRTVYVPEVNSSILLDSNGLMSLGTVQTFINYGDNALNGMLQDGDISAYSITIDPSQKILQTGNLAVTASIEPVGCAANINITLGFALSV